MRLRSAVLGLVLALLVLPVAASSRPLSQIRSDIARTKQRLDVKRGRAQVLTTDVAHWQQRVDALQGSITSLEQRQAAIQVDLDRKRAKLLAVQSDLRAARARLADLRRRLAHSRNVLAHRLVQMYEADRPDIVTVVLDSHGFSDLLESGHFLARIGAQDRRIIEAVRAAKAETTAIVGRLDRLERTQRALTIAVLARRNEIARVRLALVARRTAYARARDARAAQLARVRTSADSLHHRLDDLEGEQAAVQRKIAAASTPGALPAGPIRGGSGSLIWPVNGPITSPFCERRPWEACHPGIDIGVPSGTPIRAAASGTVIIAGPVSGYGNYTCIQHAGPLSTCYGHQSSIGVHVGESVTQGQVIGLSGCTGLCFGPHLHFETRINGSVVNPLNYL